MMRDLGFQEAEILAFSVPFDYLFMSCETNGLKNSAILPLSRIAIVVQSEDGCSGVAAAPS